jgi:hypothetical protein
VLVQDALLSHVAVPSKHSLLSEHTSKIGVYDDIQNTPTLFVMDVLQA